MKNKYIILLAISVLLSTTSFSQDFFRIRADFTIKKKSIDGQSNLTIGKVYYDKNIKKLVFDISFPEKEIWVQKDTLMYKIKNKKLIDKIKSINIAEFTIFHMALNGKLSDFGLKNTEFTLTNVEKEGDNVFSTWSPPKAQKDYFGDIIIQKTKQNITGIVFLNSNNEIISRQFFRNYINVDGLSFPTEIIVETIINGEKFYEITTYENVAVNDFENKDMYDYEIEKYK